MTKIENYFIHITDTKDGSHGLLCMFQDMNGKNEAHILVEDSGEDQIKSFQLDVSKMPTNVILDLSRGLSRLEFRSLRLDLSETEITKLGKGTVQGIKSPYYEFTYFELEDDALKEEIKNAPLFSPIIHLPPDLFGSSDEVLH